MQTHLPIHCSADIGHSIFWVYNQRPTFESRATGASVGCSDPTFARLQTMQLSPMPLQGSQTPQAGFLWHWCAAHYSVGQHPSVHAMRTESFCQLLPTLLEAQSITKLF